MQITVIGLSYAGALLRACFANSAHAAVCDNKHRPEIETLRIVAANDKGELAMGRTHEAPDHVVSFYYAVNR